VGPFRAAPLRFAASLRGKTIIIIVVTVLSLVGGLYSLARVIILRGFVKVEEDFARQNLERASSALANELDTLERTTSEYAAWDQTYAFLHGKYPGYVKSEFPIPTFVQLKVNFVVILDKSGRKVFSKGFSLTRLEEAAVPPDLDRHLKIGSLLATHKSDESRVMGILMLASGPYLVDSHPVLTSDEQGPAAGTLLMGRALDADEVLRLAAMTHMPLELERLDRAPLNPDFTQAAGTLSKPAPVLTRALNSDILAAY